MPKTNKTLHERFENKLKLTPSGCLEFTGAKTAGGYGHFNVGNKMQSAHRFNWERLKGPVPSGLVLDHLCRNRSCVNVNHLRPCTNRENIIAPGSLHNKTKREKSQCPKGHQYCHENTYRYKGGRHCRKCHRESERIRRLKNK